MTENQSGNKKQGFKSVCILQSKPSYMLLFIFLPLYSHYRRIDDDGDQYIDRLLMHAIVIVIVLSFLLLLLLV